MRRGAEVLDLSREFVRPPLLFDVRQIHVSVSPAKAFAAIRRLGGANGWYYADWLWEIRLFMERLAGGVGRRRRRDPEAIAVGDAIDCWRVEAYEPDRRIRLALELRQPGQGWLEFVVSPNGSGSVIRQTAEYNPLGILGKVHWFLVSPLHNLMFPGMLRGIAAYCEDDGHGPARS